MNPLESDNSWYYVDQGERAGPVSREAIESMQASGAITPDTLVWHPSLTQWTRCREVFQPADALYCAVCGGAKDPGEVLTIFDRHVCAGCKPLYLQRLREGILSPSSIVYASFWVRFAAKFIDGIVMIALSTALSGVAMPLIVNLEDPVMVSLIQIIIWGMQMAVGVAYATYFLGAYGATPGKILCRIKVITADGERVSYLRAFARHFAEMLSGAVCYIGYIMAAFDEEHRTLHDHLCNTRVVTEESSPV